MNNTVIKIENLSKQYRLGLVGTGSLGHDINRWWAKLRGKPDPYLKIGEANDRTQQGDSEYVWALKDINFEVKLGEVLGIIGRNGAGKSTLLKILSRVTAPTTGNVKVKGRIASLLEVGTGFHPELTGRENIYLNGAINGMTKVEVTKKLDEIVDFSGCERYVDTPVKRYSSGMLVRLGFSVAAHLDSEILIVDEVLAVGDAEFQKKCLGKMKDAAGIGRTVLFVSHNMNALRSLCERAILIENGKQSLNGEPHFVIESYLSQYDVATVSYDVRDWARPSHLSRAVEFVSMELHAPSNLPRLKYHDPLSFNFTLKLTQDVKQFNIGIAILANDGTPVGLCFSNTILSGFSNEFKKYCLEFMEHQLAPGRYRCIVSVGKGNEYEGRIDYDLISDVLMFEILPADDTRGRVMKWSSNWGCIRLPEPVITEVDCK